MTGHIRRDGLKAADGEAFVILEKMIELPPIPSEFGAGVETLKQISESVLHPHDIIADRQPAAQGDCR